MERAGRPGTAPRVRALARAVLSRASLEPIKDATTADLRGTEFPRRLRPRSASASALFPVPHRLAIRLGPPAAGYRLVRAFGRDPYALYRERGETALRVRHR